MKIGVTGSRNFTDYEYLKSSLDSLNPTEIISGGAKGADSLAKKYAGEKGLPIIELLPKFKTDKATPYHPKWYIERNKQIAQDCDHLAAFWDGASRGTKHTIDFAEKASKPITIFPGPYQN